MKIEKFIKFSIIFSILPAIYFALFPGKIVLITIICSYPLILFVFIKWKNLVVSPREFSINLFFWYSLIILFRGFIEAESNADWINLLSTGVALFLFLPLTIHFGRNINFSLAAINSFIIYGIPLVFILFFISDDSGPFGFAHMISPIYLLILLIPVLNLKLSLIIILITIISFFSDISIRSNLLNISVAFLICSTFLLKNRKFILRILKILRTFFLYSPIFFIILGATGIFNIFQIGDSLDEFIIDDGKGNTQDVFVDSRTEVYSDVLSQLSIKNAFVFGLGASGKTKTHLTNVQNSDFDKVYKEGRRGTESGMLNYIQYGGFLGALFYLILFMRASYLAVYRSNNWLIIMIGMWVSFKGFYSFIEDTTVFSVSTIFIFISIGLCFNNELRSLQDDEIKALFRKKLFKKVVF